MQLAARQYGETGRDREADRNLSIRETDSGNTASSQPHSQHTCRGRAEDGRHQHLSCYGDIALPATCGKRLILYLQGPFSKLLPALWIPLDEGDVQHGGHVPLLYVKQPLDHTMSRHCGVPGGSQLRRAPDLVLNRCPSLFLSQLVLHLLTPQRHGHAPVHLVCVM